MKVVKIAYSILCISLILVVVNSIVLGKVIDSISEMVENADYDDAKEIKKEFEEIYEVFRKKESYIALTVSHDDLTNIEDAFAEVIGAADANDMASVTTAKSRLSDALRHLKRLSGINIDSIL